MYLWTLGVASFLYRGSSSTLNTGLYLPLFFSTAIVSLPGSVCLRTQWSPLPASWWYQAPWSACWQHIHSRLLDVPKPVRIIYSKPCITALQILKTFRSMKLRSFVTINRLIKPVLSIRISSTSNMEIYHTRRNSNTNYKAALVKNLCSLSPLGSTVRAGAGGRPESGVDFHSLEPGQAMKALVSSSGSTSVPVARSYKN